MAYIEHEEIAELVDCEAIDHATALALHAQIDIRESIEDLITALVNEQISIRGTVVAVIREAGNE